MSGAGAPRPESSDVSEVVVLARPTAVIAAATSWAAFPALWPALLDEVWRAVRGDPQVGAGRNVMLYRDDVPHVEVGVEAAGAFAPIGRVEASQLPAGRALMVTYRGPYEHLGRGHEAIVAAARRRGLTCPGPRWEIYGHQHDPSAEPTVEIYHLVAGARP